MLIFFFIRGEEFSCQWKTFMNPELPLFTPDSDSIQLKLH